MDFDRPVIFDANVLFPFHIGHILVFMASDGLVDAKWTAAIQDEWIRNIAKKFPEDLEGCIARKDAMNRAVRRAMVTGHEGLIEGIEFSDPDDRHVIAAALHVNARGVVTRDRKHFTPTSLAPFDLKVIDPDDLLVECYDRFPEDCVRTVERARLSLTKTKPSLDEYLGTLESQQLGDFVRRMRVPDPRP